MGRTVEPKMDELKRLLRRLDGLDGSKGPAKGAQDAEAEQRGYVGALRGAPVPADPDVASSVVPPPPSQRKAAGAPVFVAAVMAAVVSTVTVYLVMSGKGTPPGERGAGAPPASEGAVPRKLEFKLPGPGDAQPRQSNDTVDGLVRRAEQLLKSGDIETARALLAQAAEQGSGPAALQLGRSYDPTQAQALRYADSQTNPALAKAWYERALALGTREAAGYISSTGGQ